MPSRSIGSLTLKPVRSKRVSKARKGSKVGSKTKKGSVQHKPSVQRKSSVQHKGSKVGSRAQVLHGTRQKTAGGLTSYDLMLNERGKIVSKKKHTLGKIAFKRNGLAQYIKTPAELARLAEKARSRK